MTMSPFLGGSSLHLSVLWRLFPQSGPGSSPSTCDRRCLRCEHCHEHWGPGHPAPSLCLSSLQLQRYNPQAGPGCTQAWAAHTQGGRQEGPG